MQARERPKWLPSIWYLAAVSIISALSAWAGIALTRQAGNIAAIWFTNGILLAVLLTRTTRQWPVLLAAGLAGLAVAGHLAGHSAAAVLVLLGSGAVGIVAPAIVLRHRHGDSPDLSLPGVFIEFALIGAALTPALSGLVGALLLSPMWHQPFLPLLVRWYLGDALGILVMTPLAVALLRGELAPLLAPAALARTLGVVGAYVAVVVAVFAQSRIPLLFLPMPPLLLAVSWLGLPGAGLLILPTAAIAFGVTVAGHGPLLLIQDVSSAERLAFLQIYIAIAATTAYSIGIIVAGRRRLNQALLDRNERLAGSERRYRLLADNASDIITRTRLDGQRVYVSPSCQDVLGWSVAEMLRADWQDKVHPDDVAIFISVRDRMQAGASQAGATYRYRRKDGGWAWIEARARMVLEPDGSATEFTGVLRDVSRQMAAELALAAATAELSQQASTDGLTGIANRRRFDEMLPREWRRAMRAGDPLSLLVVDVDHFKAFNESYGHLGGDECLRLIAQTIAAVIRRPHDLVARYGGEEFVAVLPATTQDGAKRIAEDLCAAVVAMGVPHAAAGGSVTVSIGAATAFPTGDIEPAALIDAADGALYAAKRGGRNCVATASLPDPVRAPRRAAG